MVEKPTLGDSQQREDQTRAARAQSGLPPDNEPTTKQGEQSKGPKKESSRGRR